MMKKIVIVGGGVAGLSAGIYGQLAGFDCKILERHFRPGGNLTGWERDGFHIDNCIHWLTGTKEGTKLRQRWEEVGALYPGIGLCHTERLYGSTLDGKSVSMSCDVEQTREQMLSVSPRDGAETESFISAVKSCMRAMAPGRMSPGEAASYGAAMVKYGRMDLYTLAGKFRHPLLKRLMTDYIGGEYVAAALVLAYAAYASGNGGIPAGGSLQMAERMAARFRALGGELSTSAEVSGVRLENTRASGVLLCDGSFVPADYVVCACDTDVTFGRLLGEKYMPQRLRRCYADDKRYPVFSSFHAAFAADVLPQKLRHTEIFDVPPVQVGRVSVRRMAVREYSHEPSFAPEGKTVIQSMVFQRADDCENWQKMRADAAAYKAEKMRIAGQMMSGLEAHCPELCGKLRVLDTWTPATYNRYFGAYKGAYMCFAMLPGIRGRRVGSRIRGLENVVLASQWQQMPGGLPTALNAGRAAADVIAALDRPGKRLPGRVAVLS